MLKKYRSLITLCVMIVVLFGLTLTCWFKPTTAFSDTERRELAKRPELSWSALLDGTYMTKFEKWTQDQFPLRDRFRTLNALSSTYVFRQKDNNDLYLSGGYLAKLDFPLDEKSIEYATSRFRYVYEQYLRDCGANVYLSVIPDKGYFLAEANGYPHMDYEKLFSSMRGQMDFAKYIDITGTLSIGDYYKTDTHWRQENLGETAAALASGMGITLKDTYTKNRLEHPFHGVYYGQAALPLPAETIWYLTSKTIDGCTVINGENNTEMGMYDMEKAVGKDPYQMFLSGSLSLITIENPSATTDRELIIFRDSFGSSIAPLLAEGYAKITLVDIRYLSPALLGRFVDFNDKCDVLFLYSTLVLNSSSTIQ